MNRGKLLLTAAASVGVVGAMTATERKHGRFMRGPEPHPAPPQTADQILESLKKDLGGVADKAKEIATDALGKAEKGEKMVQAAKEAADEILLKHNTLLETVNSLEQKMAGIDQGGDPEITKTIGQQFVESEDFIAFNEGAASPNKSVNLNVKAAITSLTTDAAGSAGAGVEPTRLPGIDASPQEQLTMRDLITPGQMSGASVQFVQQSGFTNNAAMVAEGGLKPQSDIQLSLETVQAQVIAHTMNASLQILDDIPQLQSFLNSNMIYGVKLKEDRQILNGDGQNQNLLGIIPQATDYALPSGIASADVVTQIDVLRVAMLQTLLAEYPATGHVLNPIDWAKMEMLRVSGTDERYLIGDPQSSTVPRLWGLPVVTTQAITAGRFLTGAFRLGAQLFDRWEARVQIATENKDDFEKNMLTIRAEERLALAVYRGESFIEGSLSLAE